MYYNSYNNIKYNDIITQKYITSQQYCRLFESGKVGKRLK